MLAWFLIKPELERESWRIRFEARWEAERVKFLESARGRFEEWAPGTAEYFAKREECPPTLDSHTILKFIRRADALLTVELAQKGLYPYWVSQDYRYKAPGHDLQHWFTDRLVILGGKTGLDVLAGKDGDVKLLEACRQALRDGNFRYPKTVPGHDEAILERFHSDAQSDEK